MASQAWVSGFVRGKELRGEKQTFRIRTPNRQKHAKQASDPGVLERVPYRPLRRCLKSLCNTCVTHSLFLSLSLSQADGLNVEVDTQSPNRIHKVLAAGFGRLGKLGHAYSGGVLGLQVMLHPASVAFCCNSWQSTKVFAVLSAGVAEGPLWCECAGKRRRTTVRWGPYGMSLNGHFYLTCVQAEFSGSSK